MKNEKFLVEFIAPTREDAVRLLVNHVYLVESTLGKSYVELIQKGKCPMKLGPYGVVAIQDLAMYSHCQKLVLSLYVEKYVVLRKMSFQQTLQKRLVLISLVSWAFSDFVVHE